MPMDRSAELQPTIMPEADFVFEFRMVVGHATDSRAKWGAAVESFVHASKVDMSKKSPASVNPDRPIIEGLRFPMEENVSDVEDDCLDQPLRRRIGHPPAFRACRARCVRRAV